MPKSKMELNPFQQWTLLTFALLGLFVFIDSLMHGILSRQSIFKNLAISVITAALFVALWNWLHKRGGETGS